MKLSKNKEVAYFVTKENTLWFSRLGRKCSVCYPADAHPSL